MNLLFNYSRHSREGGSLAVLFSLFVKNHWVLAFTSTTIILFLLLCCTQVFALETPHSGHLDRRVKHIDYNQQQVVKLVGHYGFSTDIAFAVNEAIKQIAMGDADAWAVTPVDNHISTRV